MENTMDKDKQKDQENDKHVDEGAHVKMQGHLLIRDAETGEELVNKRNAIHFGNMAFVIANAMSYWWHLFDFCHLWCDGFADDRNSPFMITT